MRLMRQEIGLAQVLGVGMLILAGCGDDNKKHDAGDGGFDTRRDGPGLEVREAGQVGEAGEVGEVGAADASDAAVDLGGDAITEAGPGDTTRDVTGDGVDAPIGDGAIDAPITEVARDAPLGDVAGDLGEVGPLSLLATLGGDEETPPVSTTATGTASFILDPGMTALTFHLVHTMVNATAAHIHASAGGEAGPILFSLSPVGADISGTVNLTPAQAVELLAGRMYVNVHSTAHPEGEIRGQILLPGETLFLATLTGDQEVPPAETTGTGSAAVILSSAKDSIKYHLHTSLTPTNAHIHTAIGGVSGPVTIPFTPIAQTIDGTAALTPAQATDLAEGRMYANVHTTTYPNGEIRGQLLLPGETLATATLSGTNETPPVATTASGAAAFILSYRRDTMRYEGVFTGLSGPATEVDLTGGISGDAGVANYQLALVSGGAGIKGVQAVLPTDVAALMASPPGITVNVRTAAHPNGEISGPLMVQQ
jgi:trimeric autotransporter adhesin